jgi:hypothetical protein
MAGFASQVSGHGPQREERVGDPEDPRRIGGKFKKFDPVAISKENAGKPGGDTDIPENHPRHQGGRRAGRSATDTGKQPDGEAKTSRAGPPVNQCIDGGGPDVTVGEEAARTGKRDQKSDDRKSVLRMRQRRSIDEQERTDDHPVHGGKKADKHGPAHRCVDGGKLGIRRDESVVSRGNVRGSGHGITCSVSR